MKRIAIMYDFDDTLNNGQESIEKIFANFKIDYKETFRKTLEFCRENNADIIMGLMYNVLAEAKKQKVKITKELMADCGKYVCPLDGVKEWFDDINAYAKSKGFLVDHYVISCMFKEIIENSELAKNFTQIFANYYIYDKNGEACWPAQMVNYTTKTQYLFRIKKNLLKDLYDAKTINNKFNPKEILPYKNMIYIGDGDTDIPCMKIVKDKGGLSICVYNDYQENSRQFAQEIYESGRVNNMFLADYKKGSELNNYLKSYIEELAK